MATGTICTAVCLQHAQITRMANGLVAVPPGRHHCLLMLRTITTGLSDPLHQLTSAGLHSSVRQPQPMEPPL